MTSNSKSMRPGRLASAAAVLLVMLAGLGCWLSRHDDPAPAPLPAGQIGASPRGAAGEVVARGVAGDPAAAAALERAAAPTGAPAEPVVDGLRGTVRVAVYRWPAQPIEGARVVIPPVRGVTDAAGEVLLQVDPGYHRVLVDQVPEGLRGPWADWLREVGDDPDGLCCHHVQVEVGEEVRHAVRLFAPCQLQGFVVDVHGAPVVGREVVLRPVAAALRRQLLSERTDGAGMFAFADLLPAEYDVVVTRSEGVAAPMPRRVRPPEGSVTVLPPISLGSGTGALRGRACGDRGEPLVGVPVTVWAAPGSLAGTEQSSRPEEALHEVLTDARGDFVCERLQAGSVVVQVHRTWAAGPDARQLLEPIAAVPVEVRDGQCAELGPLVGRLARPFELSVQHVPSDCRVFVVAESRRNQGQQAWQELRVRSRFGAPADHPWFCATPHEPVWVLVTRGDAPAWQRRVVPVENESRVVAARLP
ncbi:MAG: carboxypeptidase regulatory-like domain-containing protein [Planctomycetes bacterium]|nr:carboxypeptidase regulatory-like domain-containing protein [Planctomycetota bacterium]